MEELIRNIYEQARLIGACDKFTGKEHTLEEIVRLFLSVHGIEFCLKNQFPNIATFRAFKEHEEWLQEHGIYIDAGAISLKNRDMVVLIGRTSATLVYDELKRHKVVLLQGAKATIGAWKWALVNIQKDDTCEVIKSAYNNAIIL